MNSMDRDHRLAELRDAADEAAEWADRAEAHRVEQDQLDDELAQERTLDRRYWIS